MSSDQIKRFKEESVQQYKCRYADHFEDQLHRLPGQIYSLDFARSQAVWIHEFRSLDLLQGQQSQTTASLPSRVDLPKVRSNIYIVMLDVGQIFLMIRLSIYDDSQENEG